MASVIEDLKAKLAELEDRLRAIREEETTLEGQKAAFQTVIKVYDPGFSCGSVPQPRPRDRATPGRRVTDLLKGRDIRRNVLEILRDADTPLLASELSRRFIIRESIQEDTLGIGPNLAGRFSGLLVRMEPSGVVKSSEAPDGRRRLWQIAR